MLFQVFFPSGGNQLCGWTWDTLIPHTLTCFHTALSVYQQSLLPHTLGKMSFLELYHLYILAFIKTCSFHLVFSVADMLLPVPNNKAFSGTTSAPHWKLPRTLSGCLRSFTIHVTMPHSSTQGVKFADKTPRLSGHCHFMIWGNSADTVSQVLAKSEV